MAFLVSQNASDNEDFTKDIFFTDYGPFGISGFNCDGKEVGNDCHLCEVTLDASSLAYSHFSGKKHATKLKQYISAQSRLVIESSTGNLDDPDNLYLLTYCKVCDAELAADDQATAHYMSEKHQKKVRHYFLVKVGAKEVHPSKQQDPEEKKRELESSSKMEYCSLCDCEFTAPIVARAHYAGKKHAKKLKEKAEFDAISENAINWKRCEPCALDLNSRQQYLLHVVTTKHKANVEKDVSAAEKMQALARRREEIETQMSEEEAKRKLLESELEAIDTQLSSQSN